MADKRNIVMIYVFGFLTFGLYFLYWFVKTKDEMNPLGADIPTAWLIIIPIANVYWFYKYCEGFSKYVKKDDNAVLWFLVYLVASIIMPAIVQSELNKLTKS